MNILSNFIRPMQFSRGTNDLSGKNHPIIHPTLVSTSSPTSVDGNQGT